MAKRQDELSVWAVARTSSAVFVLGGALLAPCPALPQALPSGGTVTHGTATIATPQGGTLNINQSSNRAIIDWNSFSVGAGGRVNFNQPGASAATLNRVTGSTSSTIAGAITAPGTVLLVNPNGIAITPTGTVNVGSFAASALDIKNSDFLAGNYKFTGNGTSATVTNAGRINVSDGGFAALLGGRVANDGIITARLGRVGLGSGEKITLDLSGDGFLQVEVPSNQLGNLVDGTGQALVSNRGKIRANGGIVHLSAATASNILRDAVNVPGSIRANSVGTRGGRIVLGGGAGGRVSVSGRLSASGTRVARRHQPAAGGQIDIAGAEIALTGARLNASGATGGGRIRIGGDYQGSGDFPHAQHVSIDTASVIRADATQSGNGGTIIVWSDGLTSVSGAFSARGGANGGNGGLVETSGHQLEFAGTRVDTSARRGRTGEWLLDPESLTVDSAAAATIAANLANSSVTLLTTSTIASGPGDRWAGAGDIFIQAPIYWTSGNTLRLNAYNSIIINATIVGTGASTLWLTTGASGGVWQTAPISVQNLILPINFSSVTLTNSGNVVGYLWTDTSTLDPSGDTFNANPGAISFTNNGSLITGRLYANGLTLNVGGQLTLSDFMTGVATNRSTVTSITASGNITSANQFGSIVGADLSITAGGSIALNSVAAGGVLSIRANGNISFNENVVDFFDRPITSTTIRSDNGLVTFASGKKIFTANAVEILYNPFAVYGTYANVSSYAGLTSGVGNGSVTAYMLINDLNQLNAVGTNLAGTYALGRDIDASASVNMNCLQGICGGFAPIGRNGGFTGLFDGRGYVVSNLYQNWQTSLVGSQGVGLFSINRGTIRNVGILGGNLTGIGDSGGLAATNSGTISNSFSTATVRGIQEPNGRAAVGGLVGLNTGTINAGSYSTGNVTGIWAGGLVGENRAYVWDSYAAGNVNGTYAGGLVGVNNGGGDIRWAYSLSTVYGSSAAGGLVGVNAWGGAGSSNWGAITSTYAAGRVTGSGYVGGIVGDNRFADNDTMESFNSQHSQSARVWYSYFDVATTGTTRAYGRSYHDMPGGWSSEQIQYIGSLGTSSGTTPYSLLSYRYFNQPTIGNPGTEQMGFNSHWYIVEGQTRPFLRAEYATNIQNLHQLQLVNMNGAANYTLARNIDATAELASGMWNNNRFSPIRPITWTDTYIPTYFRDPITGVQTQIGTSYEPSPTVSSFTGSLNGQGYAISNLRVDRTLAYSIPYLDDPGNPIYQAWGGNHPWRSILTPGGNAGLFDTIASGGSVRNLGIVNSQFIARSGFAGSIAAVNQGVIERSYAVRGAGTSGENVIADFVGAVAGGLVGQNTGRISESYAGVNVWAAGQGGGDLNYGFFTTLGGLVGQNTGTIENAYATGRVLGNAVIGGLVGSNSGTIRNTYSVTELGRAYEGYGINLAGWLVGSTSGSVINSYYLSGRFVDVGGGGINYTGTGLSQAELQNINTFATVYQGWDFQNIWIPPNQAGQAGQATAHYPEFYWGNYVAVVQTANATRTYGDANPPLLTSVYGLRSYDTPAAVPVTVSTSANATSNVGNYDLSTSITVVPPTVVACACGSTAGRTNWGLYINNIDVEFFNAASLSLQQVVDIFNGRTWRTGVTASIGPTGGLQLTSAGTFTLSGMGVLWGNALDWLGLPNGPVQPRQLQAVSTDGTAYRVINLPGTLSVTQRAITVAGNNQNQVYGATGSPLTYSITSGSLVNGDQLSGALTRAAGNNVGTYAINQGSLSASSNYALTYQTGGTLTITRATLTYSANTASRAYGDDNSAFGGSVTGFVNGDTLVSATAGTLSFNSSATATSVVGQYAINGSGLSAGNYVFQQAAGNNTALTVNRRNVTVTANEASREYGLANPALTYGTSSLGAGVAVTGALSTSATQASDVGQYAIQQGTVTNATNTNYNITYVGANLTVNQAELTFTATGTTRSYGDVNPTLTGQVTGFRNGQSAQDFGGGVWSTTATATSVIGNYAINGNLAGASPNYRLTQAAGNANALTIAQRNVLVSATAASRYYGDDNPALTFTSSDLGAGIDIAGNLTVGAGATSNVGGYAIGQGTVTNANNANYNITYAGANLTVDRRPVTVTANDQSRTYGAANPTLTFTNTGLGAGVAIAGDLSVAADARSNVGGYAIGQGTVTNVTNSNYAITYVGGTLTIDPATITVTANGGRSIYGQSPANPGLSATGLQNGEDVSVLTGLTNSFGVASRTNAGRYTLNVDGDLTNGNYTVKVRNAGEWTVDPAAIIVTANGGRSIYGQSPLNPGISATGLQNGEGVSELTGLTNTFGITNQTGAGNHTLRVAGTLTNGNYTITARNDGIWAVNPAAITVTANGGRSTYGQNPTNPGFGATGLQNGEGVNVLTGLANTFGITGRTNAGGYALSVGGRLSNPNYVVTGSIGGLWTVDRAALAVAANPQSRLVTELDPLLTYRITAGQFFNGDGFAGELARERGDAPGNYAITQGSLAASTNYTLTFAGSTLEIRALPSDGPSQGRPNGPVGEGGTTTISFQPASTPPVTFGGSNPSSSRSTSTTPPTTVAAVNPVDPVVTATVSATERVLTYLPISQFEAREYTGGTLPGYEDRTGEATVLTMIARALAGERTNTLFIDNFWNTTANSNAGATEFDLIAQRVTFSNGQDKKADPEKAEPFTLQGNDPAKLLQSGPLMIVATDSNGVQSWMLAIRMTEDGKGIVANDPSTGRQVTLAYNAETRAIGGVTSVLDPKTNSWIAIDNAEALKAAGLEQFTAERVASLQAFAPTAYLAVGVN